MKIKRSKENIFHNLNSPERKLDSWFCLPSIAAIIGLCECGEGEQLKAKVYIYMRYKDEGVERVL